MFFLIETLGCQMNVLDSELASASLLKSGFSPTGERKIADIYLFNTCSIRQHAEDKVYSALGRLRGWKEKNPERILGVLGCMAQKDQELIFRRAPHVDLVLGPGQLERLPRLIEEIIEERKRKSGPISPAADTDSQNGPGRKKERPIRRLEISLDRRSGRHEDVKESFRKFDPRRLPQVRKNSFQAMVRIMFGCDKFCSYCIVPSVRGPEQSRDPREIEQEIRVLAEQGVKEITLIGQTVNSYRFQSGGKTSHLSDLLEIASGIEGIRRIRFLTNYPRGMSDDLLQAVRDLPKVAPYFHVPVQSGSTTVLQRMKRHYSAEEYYELLHRIRETVPGAAITSDFIVGFCGESEEEFQQSKDMVRIGRFKNSFIFKYSERPGTKSAQLYKDDVPEEIKKRRNNELLEIQDAISLQWNREFLAQTVEVLIEEENEKGPEAPQLLGRTACDRIVACEGDPGLIGQFVSVEITDALPFTLLGRIRTP